MAEPNGCRETAQGNPRQCSDGSALCRQVPGVKMSLWALRRAGLAELRQEVYAFCVDAQARSAVPGQEGVALHFQDQVSDRSWTETHETRTETITCSCVLYPVADSTRLTVTAQYVPKGIGRMFSGAKEGAYRKREVARLGTEEGRGEGSQEGRKQLENPASLRNRWSG